MHPLEMSPNRRSFTAGLLWFLTFLAGTAPAGSAWYNRVWQTDDGLLNNNIHSLAQTADDYLWISTPVSLMRFDGVSFTPFPVKEFTGQIEPHNVRAVYYGHSGVLWVVPNLGPMIGLKPDFSRVTLPRSGVPTNSPATFAEDSGGALWLGYVNGIYCIKDNQVKRYGTAQGMPADGSPTLCGDGAGNVWLAKGRQMCVLQNGTFQPMGTTSGVQCLAAAHTNGVWYVADSHLYSCHVGGTIEDHGVFQDPPAAVADALIEDHTGAVWIGTDGNGLFRYSSPGFERVDTSHSSILSLAEDREGNIWAGTGGGGLDRISLSSVRQEVLQSQRTREQIQSICEDATGRLWGATHNGVLVSRDTNGWSPVLTGASFHGTVMCVAAAQDGGVWVGTRTGTLFNVAGTNISELDPRNGAIFAIEPGQNRDLWILGRRLQHWRDGQFQDANLPRQAQRISAMATDANGNVWVGAKGMVLRYDGTEFVDETPHLPLSRRSICCLYGSRDGSMWISCGGLGLLRYKDGRVGQITADQGLFNDYISQIVADEDGWFWFGSDRGIFKIRQSELEQALADHGRRLRPIVYGRNEGLPSLEAVFSTASPFVVPRAIRTTDGRVWMLMHTGIVVAEPRVVAEDFSAPRVLLTSVSMDGQAIASYGGIAPARAVASLTSLDAPLRLPPGHRHLQFEFTAIHLSAPENVRFRYQLVNFDNDWIEGGTQRGADYSRLPAGDYQLRVQACIGDGSWTPAPVSLSLSVAPFLWQTWWFRLVVVLVFTAMVIAVVRYISFRRLQLQMRLLEQRAALDKERTRIARDLHDDLGGSLNSVALSLDMMQRSPVPLDSMNSRIRRCTSMVRQVAKSVDEIVWAINPRNDTLRYVVDYISQFAVEYMHAADVPCRVELPDRIPDGVLSPEVRHNLFLVVKEALNNIVTHAQASEVHLQIATAENRLVIAIRDNGKGFAGAPDNASSDGLRNMRQRMEEIGGQFQLETRPGAGTSVTFGYSWPSNNGNHGNPNMPYLFNGHRRE